MRMLFALIEVDLVIISRSARNRVQLGKVFVG